VGELISTCVDVAPNHQRPLDNKHARATRNFRRANAIKQNKVKAKIQSAHLVFDGVSLAVSLIGDRDVQITVVLRIRCTRQSTPDLLAFGDGDRRWGVEYSLFPVGVSRVGTSRETHVLVCARERNVKPRQEGMDVIIPRGSQLKWCLKREILLLGRTDVDVLEFARIGHCRLELDGVNQGLSQAISLMTE